MVNARWLKLLLADPATAPHDVGVLVIDDSGDRKDSTATAHVGHQWLGRYGKTDNGVITVATSPRCGLTNDSITRCMRCPTPRPGTSLGRSDPAFRTKLAIGADLAIKARAAGFAFAR